MTITGIKTLLTCPAQNYLFVKILTDDPNIYGWGEASLNGRDKTVADLIDEYLAPMLVGMDPDCTEDIWQLIYRGSYWRGGNVMMSALSGIDMALWDIRAKRAGLPLYSLLGGKVRSRVLAYTHVLGKPGATVGTFEEKAQQAVDFVNEQHARVIRLRAGVPAANGTMGNRQHQNRPIVEYWDSEREVDKAINYFIAIREKVGPDIGICYDLHSRFSVPEAIHIIRALEPYKPFFIEDPVAPDCIQSLRSVREKTAAPLAFGELFKSRYEHLPVMNERLADYIRTDIVRVGGITELKKINTLAETYDIRTAWHGCNDLSPLCHAVNWHFNVSSYNFGIQEYGNINPVVSSIVKGGPVYKEGYLYMEDRPGIGIEIDEEMAARYPYVRAYVPYCRRSTDGSIVDW